MEHNPKSVVIPSGAKDPGPDEVPVKGGATQPSAKRATGRASRVSSRSAAKATEGPGSKPKRSVPKLAAQKSGAVKPSKRSNGVRAARIERMMSKAELARRAGLSVLTIDRVEKGLDCRMDTKRKVLEALGLRPEDRVRVFGEEE
jgi:DNA-binding XRE family transcriptional regulator